MAADTLIVADNVLLGSALHSVGAICAALCYTPQQKLRAWSWQTYWLTQAAICWLTNERCSTRLLRSWDRSSVIRSSRSIARQSASHW